ncbi:hypothetical protein S40288_01638 [Stachybotrys chartarum IBT 40288]|nr:hypothetical protein S40288_01638 [Stachybotrys chartarum IBT 40288]
MPPRISLKSFLARARTSLTLPTGQRLNPLTFVVGNEAADLDSLCSALVLAYIRSNTAPHTLHVPLSNIPREDLALRTEMTAVLRHAGLTPADLLTLTELPSLKPEDTRWVLVDHNSLTGQLGQFAGRVVGCVDHHVDEGAVGKDVQPRVIEPCGSCISLIINEERESWDELSGLQLEEGDVAEEDEKLAKLALAPILIDTVNLTAQSKTKDKDVSAAAFLESKISDPHFKRDDYFREIAEVQQDISQLSFRDIFRKDYKEWSDANISLGVSSIPQHFEYLVNKAETADVFIDELAKWAKEKGLDIVSIMTASAGEDGEFTRQLLVWGLSDGGKAAVRKFVEMADGLKLQTWRDGELDEGQSRLAWQQGDVASSRKQVAPLLREAMKSVGA